MQELINMFDIIPTVMTIIAYESGKFFYYKLKYMFKYTRLHNFEIEAGETVFYQVLEKVYKRMETIKPGAGLAFKAGLESNKDKKAIITAFAACLFEETAKYTADSITHQLNEMDL